MIATLHFQRDTVTPALCDEIRPLINAHAAEVEDPRLKVPAFQTETYVRAASVLRVFTVRDGGVLRGYAVFFVIPNPHFADSLQAQQDALYLSPEARRGTTGTDFMRWCDRELASDGVTTIIQFSSLRRDIGRLLVRLGYEKTQELYSRTVS